MCLILFTTCQVRPVSCWIYYPDVAFYLPRVIGQSLLLSSGLLIEYWPTHATFTHKDHCYRLAAVNTKCEQLLLLLSSISSIFLPIFPLSTTSWCFDLVRQGTSLAQSPGFVKCHSEVAHTHVHTVWFGAPQCEILGDSMS